MTSILVIGDQHFKVDNIIEIDIFINIVIDIIETKNPDFVVLLGDLLHTHEKLHTIPLNKACEFINKIRLLTKVFILVGNHDYQCNSQYLTENHWLNFLKEWENIVVVDKVFKEIINGHKFIFSPYVYVGRFEEALNTIGDEWKDASLIFAHQEFYGVKMGSIISVEGDKWDKDYPNVVSGHIHDKQHLQENIYYTGSSLEMNYGDTQNNTIALLTFKNDVSKDYELEEIELNLPKKKIIYTTIEDVKTYKVEKESEDKVKISISGEYEEFKIFKKSNKYKELVNKGVKVIFKPKKIEMKLKNDSLQENINNNNGSNNFLKILDDIILAQDNPYLHQVFDLVVHSH
jgi:DNA repair exonuclease SbcCD nuclease subunit